jgi:hypothetical protein
VLKVLQGHPEASVLWEKHINKIVDDLDIEYTTHERSIYRGKIDGKVRFCADKSTTSLLLAMILLSRKV